jgi:hypothetical protein
MKKSLYAAAGLLLLFASSSCRKDNGPLGSQTPLNSNYQVVECHNNHYDADLDAHVAFPFLKKYDPSGRTVTEIDCAFDDDKSYYYFPQVYHEFKISQKGHMVYLVNKALPASGIPDTAGWITLDALGRPKSMTADSNLSLDLNGYWPEPTFTQNYTYQNNKIVAVHYVFNNPHRGDYTDSIKYDQYGNAVSFNNVSWHYDYSKTAKQQFYYEGLTGADEPFYLLLYLGYFPEISCPSNVMTAWTDFTGTFNVTNHKFDSRGRLISYDDGLGHVTVNWKP